MKETYNIFGYTVSNFGKEKNGDSFLFEHLEEENLLIAVVADGVSQQPCDWLASLTTCRSVVSYFKQNKDQKDISQRIFASILQTNKDIASTEGRCYKMASTLSIVVCQELAEDYYYANIDDSRIYSLYNRKLEQLTTDDVIIRKERVLTQAGMRVVDKAILTKVIGQDNIAIKIGKKSIQAGEVLILATDGFYEARKATFSRIIMEFSEAENFEEGFATLISTLEILRGDDLTAIVIKRN